MADTVESILDNIKAFSAFVDSKPNATVEELVAEYRKLNSEPPPRDELLAALLTSRADFEQILERCSMAAKQIAAAYPPMNADQLVILMLILYALKEFVLSEYDFEQGTWAIPRDLTPWKTAHAKLVGIAKRSLDLRIALEEALKEPVMFAALRHIDRNVGSYISTIFRAPRTMTAFLHDQRRHGWTAD